MIKASRSTQGFTMIELIVAIVLIGALAAVAVPRFLDLKPNAQSAVKSHVISVIRTADAMNNSIRYATNYTMGVRTFRMPCNFVIPSIVQSGQLPPGFIIYAGIIVTGNVGETFNCQMRGPDNVNFTVPITIVM